MSHECLTCDKKFQISCQATCYHWICGTCMMYIWMWRNFERCKCPICDKPVDFLIPTLKNKSRQNPQVLAKIHAYNHMFGPISNFPFFFLYHVLFRDLLTNNVSSTILLNAGFFISFTMNLAYMLSPLREKFGIIIVYLLWLIWLSRTASVYKSELCIRHGGNFRGWKIIT
ncbi:uncharacterized protein LOC131639451 [Vicia villosa]|uniref:uncharacterized protein LOC131639451 n=1 Tax=Vicia villosa TaxID=3911 RepID=UPI00273AF8F2|nr:uncharacterized protein LOC131639451 [Vicia villosa]